MEPEVGMGVSWKIWTDVVPGTITYVSPNKKTIRFKEDNAVRTDNNGMSDAQSYTYSFNPHGQEHTATLRKNGAWKLSGTSLTEYGNVVYIGGRRKYYDYSF